MPPVHLLLVRFLSTLENYIIAGTIDFTVDSDTTINAAGVVVHTQTIASPDETIHLGHLPAGMYLFRLENGGKAKTEKVIKIQ